MNPKMTLAVVLALGPSMSWAGDGELPVRAGDIGLTCQQILTERTELAKTIAAGNPNSPNFAKTVSGNAANAGGQVAGAVVAQSSGLFGSLGGLASKLAGVVAQQQVEARMGPDAEAMAKAKEAGQRDGFLNRLAQAKACRQEDPNFAGQTLSPDAFAQLSASPAAGVVSALNTDAVQKSDVTPLSSTLPLEGQLKLAGKQFYISEYRVLFEVSGKVSASTRAGYLPGTNYGATRSTIKYAIANLDIPALQAIVDRSWADFKARLAEQGVQVADSAQFVAHHGEVYSADQAASSADAPVYVEENLGYTERKFLVLAPTGTKIHSRGIAGLGAGNLGKRMEFVKGGKEGVAIGVAIHIAGLESSGSGSSILHREGASTAADEAMQLALPPRAVSVQTHAESTSARLTKPVPIPGTFARFREVDGYDTQKDTAVRTLQVLGNLAGVAANKSKTVEMAVDLDGPATARMALQGLSAFNRDVVMALK